jgi:hypothetical protein
MISPKEGTSMTLTSQIAHDTLAAHRLRLIAPLVVLLGLALLIMAPGFFAGLGDDDDAAPPRMVNQLAPDAPEG